MAYPTYYAWLVVSSVFASSIKNGVAHLQTVLPGKGAYQLTAQSEQLWDSDLSANCPIGHSVQLEEPTPEYEPAGDRKEIECLSQHHTGSIVHIPCSACQLEPHTLGDAVCGSLGEQLHYPHQQGRSSRWWRRPCPGSGQQGRMSSSSCRAGQRRCLLHKASTGWHSIGRCSTRARMACSACHPSRPCLQQ